MFEYEKILRDVTCYATTPSSTSLAVVYNLQDSMVAKDFVISGRVQGVGYRYFAQEAAERRGIRGYARNLFNGDVEVHAEGDLAALQLFKQDLQKGPRLANVTKVVETEAPVTGTYASFSIRG